jgi:outer membrane protein OmpA-like peptidoglycan-associated protein
MNAYNTNASFDYGAIYAYNTEVSGGQTAVYDNSPIPSKYDLTLTKPAITEQSGAASVASVLNQYRTLQGMNVGLNESPTKTTGNTTFTQGTLGFIVRPAYSYYISNRVAINLGVFYMFQPFNNSVKSGYMLTDKIGDYNSLTNSVSQSMQQSYGINLGVRVYLGNYHGKPGAQPVSDNSTDPTCGASDGSIMIHNLEPGQPVVINYLLNGTLQPNHSDVVSEFGTVKISNLAAGDYSNIVATVNGVDRNVPSVTLASSPIGYYSESSTNPLSFGACNGAIRMHGMKPGLPISVKYSLNGTMQPAFTGTIGQDGTVSMTGLCAGNFTGIVVNVSTCTINGTDVTLTNPAQAQVVEEEEPRPRTRHNTHVVEDRPDISTPILFDIGKTIIHESSYPVLDEALYELNEDESAYIVIDGYTDITGSVGYNKILSDNRSEAVKYYLEHRGINGSRLHPVGHGINDPIADNSTVEGRTKNRRVVMSLKNKR